MNDNPKAREVADLVAICFFGAFMLFTIIFILTLTSIHGNAEPPATATTTPQ